MIFISSEKAYPIYYWSIAI